MQRFEKTCCRSDSSEKLTMREIIIITKAKINKMQKNHECRLCDNKDKGVNLIIGEYNKKNTRLGIIGYEKWSTRNCAKD